MVQMPKSTDLRCKQQNHRLADSSFCTFYDNLNSSDQDIMKLRRKGVVEVLRGDVSKVGRPAFFYLLFYCALSLVWSSL